MCAEPQMGKMGLKEHPDDQGGQASKGREGNQGLLAFGQASKALKETRESLAFLGSQG